MSKIVDIEPNYKNPKKYKTAKYPIRQPLFFTWLIQVLSQMMLLGKDKKVEKVNMEGLKPPYMLLSNHQAFCDFELVSLGTYPAKVNNVVNIDGYYRRAWLLEWIGAICTRKFTTDFHLIKSIRKVLSRGDILCMYPEARYSPCGVTSYLPDSLGALIKMCKVPVVVAMHRGNHLHAPAYNIKQKRKVPHRTTLTKILDVDQVASMSVEQINALLREHFRYDDYRYWQESGFKITEKYRAEGLEKVLYKCPACKCEGRMATSGTELYCTECGKRYTLGEDGFLRAHEGETEFAHIPDWFAWERECVREEVRGGTYHFEDTVDVHSMPRTNSFIPLGEAKLVQDINEGFILTGHYRGEDYRIQRAPLQINSLHVEYEFPHVKPLDCIDISTENDSFYCFPSRKNVETKLAFATEEIYLLHYENARKNK